MTLTFPPGLQMGLAVFLLVLVRMSGIFLTAPFFSGMQAPLQMKVGLTFFLAACTAPLLVDEGPRAMALLGSPVSMALATAGELAVGFAIGMAGAVVLGAVQTAGSLISQDIGFTIANVIDPITNIQTSVIGQLKVALALFIFVGLDFHHGLIRLLAGSFRAVPLGSLPERLLPGGVGSRLGELALGLGSWLFEVSVRLALPITVTLLLVTVAMALLARAVPEMNVFIIGFGIRILVGMWVLVIALPVLAEAFRALFERAGREAVEALRALAGS